MSKVFRSLSFTRRQKKEKAASSEPLGTADVQVEIPKPPDLAAPAPTLAGANAARPLSTDDSAAEIASLKAEIEALKSENWSLKTSAAVQGPSTTFPMPMQGPELVLSKDDGNSGDPGKWNLLAWARGAGLHRVITAALQQAVVDKGLGDDSDAALRFIRGLKDKSEIDSLLRTEAVTGGLRDLLWSEIKALQTAGAATTEEIQGKFVGAIEAAYSGLDTYYGGLEGVCGTPSSKLFSTMEAEHTMRGDSNQEFTTGNYGVTTTSKIEWTFLVDSKATPEQLGIPRWPVESEDKLPERDKCRRKPILSELKEKAKEYNQKLEAANQPPLVDEELIAANSYTGPMFVKYNGVLRGLQSSSDFLKNTMILLCCPKDVAEQFQGTAKTFEPANGSISFEQAKSSLNLYTTTLHGINSAIIKLGKLTKATKVYRGISGMALPKEFWEPNEDSGVRGGVESAFMSTTLDRSVAMGYASSDKSRMGIVIEARQGQVDRGANMSWLSQYSHEEEILFGPLTGIEVVDTRVDGTVVVIECAFSINLTAMTLEQVLNKRFKTLQDVCNDMETEVRGSLVGTGVEEVQAAKLRAALKAQVLHEKPEAFNRDEVFAGSVQKSLMLKQEVIDGVLRERKQQLGMTCVEAKEQGYSPKEIKAAGYSCQEARDGGFTCQEAKGVGYTCKEARDGGFTCQEVKGAGYSLQEIKAAGYTCAEAKVVGYTCKEAREAGYGCHEAGQAGWSYQEGFQAGYLCCFNGKWHHYNHNCIR